MKNIFLGLLFIALLSVGTSCSDFLDEKPRTQVSTNEYYQTLNHAQSLVNKLYREGAPYYYYDEGVFSGMRIMYGPFLSGLYDNQDYKGQETWVVWMQTLNHNSKNINSQLNNLWDQAYKNSIARANTAIKHIPTIEAIPEQTRNYLVGEAKFFRAFAYLHLVRFFGDVPLIVEPYESLDSLYIERTPSEEVYAQIIQDAKDAAAVLSDTNFTNGFRATKAAAETVLASAYLQMSGYPLQLDNYKNAADAARSIINGGKHALIKHIDGDQQSAYNILRKEDNSNEYIYSREHASLENNHSNSLAQHSMPNSMLKTLPKDFNRTILVNVYKPSDIILNAFDPDDLRIQEKQFWYNQYTFTNKDNQVQTVIFDQTAVWRFYDEDALFKTTMGAKDVNIYRYPEVLLIAAEAIARSEGVTAEAVGYLADVRERAFVYPGSASGITRATIESELSALSVDKFVEEVWNERLRELAIDFKIWDDIQRTRKYPKTSATNPGKVEWIDVIGATNPFGATYQEKHLLWPISDDEIQRNPSLKQNW